MFNLLKILILISWLGLLLAHYISVVSDSVLIGIMNATLGLCILADLLYLAINSLDAPGWMPRHPRAGFDTLDRALCLVWSCLTLTPWGLIAIVTDAAVKLFSRWAQALQESHA